jgi:hypothetical protein
LLNRGEFHQIPDLVLQRTLRRVLQLDERL